MNSSVNLSSSNWTIPMSPSKCPGIVTTTILTVLIAVVGIVANGLVIRFVRSDLRQRKTPDRLLLLHTSIVNLLGCCVGLPLFYFNSEILVRLDNMNIDLDIDSSLCFVSSFMLFFCLRCGHFVLAVLCFDRFQTITIGPQAKWLTYTITKRIILAIYSLVFLVILSVMSGYIVHLTIDGQNMTCFEEVDSRLAETFGLSFSRIGLIVESVVSITIANIACLLYLQKTDKHVNQHIESVRATLGDQSTIKELRLVRSAWAFVVAYSFVWIPFGIARGVKSGYPDSLSVYCFYKVTYNLCYSVFSSIPVLYIIMDRRINIPFLRYNDVIHQDNGQGTSQET